MSHIILDNTGFLKSKTIIHEDGKVEQIHVQDIEKIIDQNKVDQNDSAFKNGYTENSDMKHVARVPLVIWKQWWMEENKRRSKSIPIYGKEMHEVVRRKLNDPDNKFLRTGLGQIGTKGEA